jgi:hypothetical protein
MPTHPLQACLDAVRAAVRDADIRCTLDEAPGYPGAEVLLPDTGPATAKVAILLERQGASARFAVRAFMFREYDKRLSISDSAEFGKRQFPLNRISRDWLRHAIATAANGARRMCEPEHQEKLRRAEMKARRKRS